MSEELEARVSMLEFKVQMLFQNTNTSRMLFESNITHAQYTQFMDLMDEYRHKLDNHEEVNHGEFEERIYQIRGTEAQGDYHFCEDLAQSFMEDGKWKEVFPALYGDMPKYEDYMDRFRWGENSIAYKVKCLITQGYRINYMEQAGMLNSGLTLWLRKGEDEDSTIEFDANSVEALKVKQLIQHLQESGLNPFFQKE